MSHSAADCLRRGLEIDAAARGFSDAYAYGGLSFLASQLYDRGESARCLAVDELRRLEAAGRAALESEHAA